MRVIDVYRGSNGALTTALYRELEKRGPLGSVAVNLFRAQKCSRRAKDYGPVAGLRGASYRELAYERKAFSIKRLTEVLAQHHIALGINYGWGRDEAQTFNKWVLYVDLPEAKGQVSFHSPERYEGPDYAGTWDGQRQSETRIIAFCQEVLARVAVTVTPTAKRKKKTDTRQLELAR